MMEENLGQEFDTGATEKCLICHCKSFDNANAVCPAESQLPLADNLSKNAEMVFILKEVLEMPAERLECYLRSGLNPESWLQICKICDQAFVQNCWKWWRELWEIRRKFDSARLELIAAVKNSEKLESLEFIRDEDKHNLKSERAIKICEEARRYVRQHEYSVTLSNPFVEGDKVARDKQLDSQVNYEISNVDGVVSMPYNDVVDIKDELVSNASDEQFPGSNWNEDSFDWISSSCSDNSEEMSGTSGTGTSNKKQPKKVYNSKSCKKPGAKVTCKICNKSLSTKQVLRHHISSVHANNRKLFTCKVCGRSHTTEVAHFRHLGAVHRIKEYWRFHCPMEGCEKGFYRNFDLKNHLNSHQEEAQFKCEICGKILRNRNAYNRHKRSHQGNLYQCNLCPDIFSRHDYLKNHVTKCHPDGKSGPGSSKRQNIKCEHCGWSFGQEWRYKHHLTVVHGVPDNEKLLERKQERKKTVEKREKKETVKRPRNKVTEPKSNTCSICQKIFSCNQARRYHVISVHEKKLQGFCELCGILVTNFKYHKAVAHGDGKNNRKIKEMTPKEKVKKMNREEKEAMKLERKGVTQSMIPSTCPTCLKVFSSKGAQQLHVNTIHEKKLQGFCDLCGRVFCSSRYLKRHKELVHENRSNINQRNLPCSVEGCSRMFYTKYQMSLHVKAVHEGNPQFQCEQCGKKLIDVTKLKRHIEAMHTNRESKPYKCDICGKGFATKDYVWLHKKTHQAKAKTNDQDSQGNGIGS